MYESIIRLEKNRKSQASSKAEREHKDDRGRETETPRRQPRCGEKKMQSRAARPGTREMREAISRAKGTCNWTTKGTTSPPPARRQRALCGTRDGGAARHCAARRGAARLDATRRGVYTSLRRDGGLAQSSTDRQRRESRGVRVEPRHDTEDLHEPRRRLGAFLKRAERRGRRRNDDGEGIG